MSCLRLRICMAEVCENCTLEHHAALPITAIRMLVEVMDSSSDRSGNVMKGLASTFIVSMDA